MKTLLLTLFIMAFGLASFCQGQTTFSLSQCGPEMLTFASAGNLNQTSVKSLETTKKEMKRLPGVKTIEVKRFKFEGTESTSIYLVLTERGQQQTPAILKSAEKILQKHQLLTTPSNSDKIACAVVVPLVALLQ